MNTETRLEGARQKATGLCDQIGRVIKGKQQAIEMSVVALLAEGHLLIEDVPGVGKTTLGHTLAVALGCTFHRLQFTSDLLPSDVLGLAVYNPDTRDFEFKPGPIFANIVLADEINRTTPKTQSALLEAMNESQVTIDNVTRPLPRPFMVLATQNPVEHHGTYPLPESQLDRFLMKIRIGYPDAAAERAILDRFTNGRYSDALQPVLSPEAVIELQEQSRTVHISDDLIDYMIRVVTETRHHPEVQLGVSPRGTVAFFRASQAYALLQGRDYVLPDDIKSLALPVLAHRMVLTHAGSSAPAAENVLEDILSRLPVPA
jgi:MoxR-like ATPase